MAAEELLRRRSARSRLIDFIHFTLPVYDNPAHQVLLAEKLEAVECGEIKRLMVFMPPRHLKSETCSIRFPAWYLGRHPQSQIIGCSYAESLAYTFSYAVRETIASPLYQNLWPLKLDTSGAVRWQLADKDNRRPSYIAAGIGGGITGEGADILVIDDPVRDYVEAMSETYRERAWNWWITVALTRLQPDAAVVLVMCMTGDTPVLMADGTERPLREIKVGDRVETYDNGRLATSTVRNHRRNGLDYILRITMTCGKIVHANERHPFLVEENGLLKWVRLKNLTTAHKIVTVKDNGASGKESSVPLRAAENPLAAGGTAPHTTIRKCGPMGIVPRQSMQCPGAIYASSGGTESPPQNMMRCMKRRTVNALSANSLRGTMCERIGVGSCALTTAMKPIQSEGFCATTVISPWDTLSQKQPHSPLSNTSDFKTESIASIEPDGVEEVFDIQVERTENFIANGLVSHNTRWHEDDLAGRILRVAKQDKNADQWEVVHFPAIKDGQALWPEKYPLEVLEKIRAGQVDDPEMPGAGSRAFEALYQGNPSRAEGNIFKREWWQYYRERPAFSHIIHSWDTAFKSASENDYSVCTVWGVTQAGYYLLDVWRQKVEFPELKRACRSLYERDHPWQVYIEDKASGQSLLQELRRDTAIPLKPVKIDSDKTARAYAVTPLIESGRVYLPERTPWLHDFIEELSAFPNGEHDDICDSTTQALNQLAGSGHRYAFEV